MLRTLMGKVHNVQEQMSNVSREMKTKNQKKMLEIKNIVTEMKNALMGLSVNWIQPRKDSV